MRNKIKELQSYEKRKLKRATDPNYVAHMREVGRKWYHDNAERIRERKRKRATERKLADLEFAEKCKTVAIQYHQEHKDEINQRHRQRTKERLAQEPDMHKKNHFAHKEKRNEYSRQYGKSERGKLAKKKYEENNPFYVRQKTQIRRARKKTTQVEPINNVVVFKRDSWICQICNEKVDISLEYPHPFSSSLDHIVPLAKGGAHTMDNIQLAHLKCNIKKHAKLLAA